MTAQYCAKRLFLMEISFLIYTHFLGDATKAQSVLVNFIPTAEMSHEHKLARS
jgi:hypothetical protein